MSSIALTLPPLSVTNLPSGLSQRASREAKGMTTPTLTFLRDRRRIAKTCPHRALAEQRDQLSVQGKRSSVRADDLQDGRANLALT
jgi:hypothetical protein